LNVIQVHGPKQGSSQVLGLQIFQLDSHAFNIFISDPFTVVCHNVRNFPIVVKITGGNSTSKHVFDFIISQKSFLFCRDALLGRPRCGAQGFRALRILKFPSASIRCNTKQKLIPLGAVLDPIIDCPRNGNRIFVNRNIVLSGVESTVETSLRFPSSVEIVRHESNKVKRLGHMRDIVRLVDSGLTNPNGSSKQKSRSVRANGFSFKFFLKNFQEANIILKVLGGGFQAEVVVARYDRVLPVNVIAVESPISEEINHLKSMGSAVLL